MTVKDVRDVLGARVLAGEEFLDRDVYKRQSLGISWG